MKVKKGQPKRYIANIIAPILHPGKYCRICAAAWNADFYFCSRSCFREFLTSLLHLFEPPNADRPIEEM
jgi:hypothetical protein